MAAGYMISKDAIVTVASGNALAMVCAAGKRGLVTRCHIGPAAVAEASMTDDTITWLLTRLTAAITGGTTVVPDPTNQESDASALTVCKHTSTAGTLAVCGILFGLNRRATYSFVANPGEEIAPKIGVANGVVLREVAVPTVYNVDASMLFLE